MGGPWAALGGPWGANAELRAIWGALGDPFWALENKKNGLENNLKFDVNSELYFLPSGGRGGQFWARFGDNLRLCNFSKK